MNFLTEVTKLLTSRGASRPEIEAAKAGVLAMAGSQWCPCGHALDSDRACLNGRIYGPCGSPHCDGPCTDTYGYCNADVCACPEEDE